MYQDERRDASRRTSCGCDRATPAERTGTSRGMNGCTFESGGCRYGNGNTERQNRTMSRDIDRMGNGCGCETEKSTCRDADGHRTWGLENYPIAMAYAPLQNFCGLYDEATALERGTIFGELDLPFLCGENGKGGGCRG